MAKLATPRLVDTATDATALAALVDRFTDVGTDPATTLTPSRVRIVLHNATGVATAALVANVHPTGGWSGTIAATVLANADPNVVGRLNRMLAGFQPTVVPTPGTLAPTALPAQFSAHAPRVETYWGSGNLRNKLVVRAPGRPVECPAVITGTNGRWSVQRAAVSVAVAANATSGFAPLTVGAAAPVSRRQPGAPSAPSAPSVAPSAPNAMGQTGGTPMTPQTPQPTALSITLPTDHPGIFRMIPAGGMKVHVTDKVRKSLDVAYAEFRAGKRSVIVLRGPSGAGKTITAQDLAARHGLPFVHVDVMGLRDFADWTGQVALRSGPNGVITEFVPSMFAEAVSADGPYAGIPRAVLLDEVNRAETAGAQNALLPVLGGHAGIYVPDARRMIPLDPACLFIATANIGALHTGTVTMDDALINRGTSWIPVDYPPADVEATILVEQSGIDRTTATSLVRAAAQVREVASRGEIERSVSTRQLVVAANHVAFGHKPVDACMDAFAETFSPEGGANSDRARVLLALNGVLR